MNSRRINQLGQRGIILFTSLAILSALLMVGIGIRVMLQNDYRVLANLRGSTEAFYLATAGLEWSKNEIARTTTFPPSLVARTENFARGTFAVTFPSSVTITALNAKIVVRSTGATGTATHTVQAQLRKAYDLTDAALGVRGNGSQLVFGSGAVLISGQDHDPVTGKPITTAKPRPAISADGDSLLGLVNAAADGLPQGSLESGGSTQASSTSDHLPASAISQLASNLCNQAAAIHSIIPPGGVLAYENQNWGTRTAPELRCIDGLADSGDAVTLAGGVGGSGILVVRDADLIVTGSFRWEGLIIVSGAEIGFKATGSAAKEILGGLILNETATSSSKALLDVQGNLRLLFSRQGLSQTASLISFTVLSSTYEHLPSTIQQEYWRSVTP
jgi:Tfp pilus assembly protein PilX